MIVYYVKASILYNKTIIDPNVKQPNQIELP